MRAVSPWTRSAEARNCHGYTRPATSPARSTVTPNQARAVAEIIMGRTQPYRETPWMWTDQLGHAIQVTGLPEANDATVVRGDLNAASATVISLRDGCVSAGVTINQSRDRRHLEALVKSRRRIDPQQLGNALISLKELV